MYNLLSACILMLLVSMCPSVSAVDQPQKLLLTPAEKAWLQEHPVIPFASDPFFPPIEFFDQNGKLAGISGDYLKLIGSKLGVEFRPIQSNSWSEALQSVADGDADLLSAHLQTGNNDDDY